MITSAAAIRLTTMETIMYVPILTDGNRYELKLTGL